VQVVIFAPEDLEILKGDPGERRYFIDQTATNLSPRVAGLRSDYERVLKQRNSLLKSASMLTGKAQQNALGTLDVWNERLVSLAAEIILLRLQTLKQLIPVTNELYQQIAPENQITFKYVSGWSDEEIKLDISWITNQLLKALTDCSQEELKRGVTLVGPHRDDVLFELNNLPVKGYASHGETWSLALSLKLAVLKLIESDINTTSSPILILDDVFAELDELRRKQLMDIALGVEQTIITAAAEVDLPENLSAKIYRFSNGEVINE
jgi:DNA replication and repair protein RecF